MTLHEAQNNIGKKILVEYFRLVEDTITHVDPSGTAVCLSTLGWVKLDRLKLISVLDSSVNESGDSNERLIEG